MAIFAKPRSFVMSFVQPVTRAAARWLASPRVSLVERCNSAALAAIVASRSMNRKHGRLSKMSTSDPFVPAKNSTIKSVDDTGESPDEMIVSIISAT